MTRVGSIILFLFILNLTANLLQELGMPVGAVQPTVTIAQSANGTYDPRNQIAVQTKSASALDAVGLILAAVNIVLGSMIDCLYSFPFYYSIFGWAAGEGSAAALISIFLTTIQFFVVSLGILEFFTNREV